MEKKTKDLLIFGLFVVIIVINLFALFNTNSYPSWFCFDNGGKCFATCEQENRIILANIITLSGTGILFWLIRRNKC